MCQCPECAGPEYEGSLIDSQFTANLRIALETVQLLEGLLSHDPFSRQSVTVSHSSCVKAALPAGTSPSSPSNLRSTSADQAGDGQVVAACAAEARDQQNSRPEHGRLTRAALMSLIVPASLPVICSHTLTRFYSDGRAAARNNILLQVMFVQ